MTKGKNGQYRGEGENRPAEKELPLSVWGYLNLLAAGLLPVAGMVVCLVWAFQTSYDTQKQNLARAMLWLHGAGITAAIIWLGVWVIRMLY